MGLDYDYKLYIKKENLKKTLKFIYEHSDKERVSFEIKDEHLYKIENFGNGRITKKLLDDFGLNQRIDTCIVVDEEDRIIEYYLWNLTQNYQPNSNDKSDFIDYYKSADKKFWIGNIEIHINDYSEKIENFVEVEFCAVTSDMSLLFANSKSIEKYFKELCKAVEVEYACIYMEDNGYRLIWAKGKDYNLTVPINWSSFQELGFIKVIKDILKI